VRGQFTRGEGELSEDDLGDGTSAGRTSATYLRHAILEMGGFPGFYGNAAFEPLRRELVGGLEPF